MPGRRPKKLIVAIVTVEDDQPVALSVVSASPDELLYAFVEGVVATASAAQGRASRLKAKP